MQQGIVTAVQDIISWAGNAQEFGAHLTVNAGGNTIFAWATTARNSFGVDRAGVAAMMAVLAAKAANPGIKVLISFEGWAEDTISGITDIRYVT